MLTEYQIEALVIRARKLTYGMWEREKRLPDFADFRAAFKSELDSNTKEEGETSGNCIA